MSQILSSMHQGNGCSAKTLGKSIFQYQTDWLDNGPAGQFGQMESALKVWITLLQSISHYLPHHVAKFVGKLGTTSVTSLPSCFNHRVLVKEVPIPGITVTEKKYMLQLFLERSQSSIIILLD